jgi:hypothetical protein
MNKLEKMIRQEHLLQDKKSEITVELNVHEVGIILSALQLLENPDENRIAREYGSAPVLYNKLYSLWETMDKSEVQLVYDVSPSF